MKFKIGQIIQHCCKFPNKDEEELDRHIILSVDGDWMETYILFTHVDAGRGYRPSGREKILISGIDSEEETPNNFYWRIMS